MSSKTDYLNKVDQQDYYDLGSCDRKCVRAPLCWMAQYSLNIHPLVALTIDYNHYTWKSNCLPLVTKTIAKDHMRSKQFEIENNLWWRILWLKDWVSESNRLSNDLSFAIHFTKLSVLLLLDLRACLWGRLVHVTSSLGLLIGTRNVHRVFQDQLEFDVNWALVYTVVGAKDVCWSCFHCM